MLLCHFYSMQRLHVPMSVIPVFKSKFNSVFKFFFSLYTYQWIMYCSQGTSPEKRILDSDIPLSTLTHRKKIEIHCPNGRSISEKLSIKTESIYTQATPGNGEMYVINGRKLLTWWKFPSLCTISLDGLHRFSNTDPTSTYNTQKVSIRGHLQEQNIRRHTHDRKDSLDYHI